MTNTVEASENISDSNQHISNNEIIVTEDNISLIETKYNLPPEIINDLQNMLEQCEDSATITLYIPNDTPSVSNSSAIPTATEYPGWSNTRTYKGYTMKDYVVKLTNAHNMTNIISANNTNDTLVQNFKKTIFAYCGNVIADSVIPFGSAATTLIDFFYANNTPAVEASKGDKLSAAPKYTMMTYYTAIVIDGRNLVYATTFTSTLEQIQWYYYSDLDHYQYNATKVYNKTIYSTNFLTRDECAYQAMSSIPHVDDQISIKINGIRFALY